MNQSLTVSVVIPVYNGAAFLAEAIESALGQTCPPQEIIVVDDGSTDDTARVAAAFGDRIQYLHQPNRGQAAARNAGLQAARGELIGFLDADDLWPAARQELLTELLRRTPTVAAALGLVQHQRLAAGGGYADFTAPRVAFNLGGALFRRSAFARVGQFDPALRHSEDVAWFLRAREQGLVMAVLPQVTLLYRLHTTNLTRDQAARETHFVRELKRSLDRRRAAGGEVAPLPPLLPAQAESVSVIIAVRNGARFLAAAIASVLAQDYPPNEVLVIDGQSTDGTAQIAQSFPAVSYVRQTDRGVANAWNAGIRAARGDLLAFLSHDDWWTPDKLSAQVGYLRDHPDIGYMTARAQFFLDPGVAIPPGFRRELLARETVAHVMETLVARRAVFAQVGLFNPDLSTAEDVDWFARAKDRGVPTAVIPRVLLHKRVHDANLSLNARENNRNLLHALKRSLERKRAGAAGHRL